MAEIIRPGMVHSSTTRTRTKMEPHKHNRLNIISLVATKKGTPNRTRKAKPFRRVNKATANDYHRLPVGRGVAI